MRKIILAATLGIALTGGCTIRHEVDAHVTVDVNLRVDQKLDSLLSYEDKLLEDMNNGQKNDKSAKGK